MLLVLEKKSQFSKEDFSISEFIDLYPGNSEVLFSVSDISDNDLTKKINKCSDLAFQTLFDDEVEIERIFNLLKLAKKALRIYISYFGLKKKLNQLFTVDELYPLIKKHQIFEINNLDTRHTEISFVDEIKWQKRVENEYLKQQNLKKFNFTGRKIKILNVMNVGVEYQHLKYGMVVNEINCSDLEPHRLPAYLNMSGGVWIWGKNRAIKLVNRPFVKEYIVLEKLTVEEVILEIATTFSKSINLFKFKKFINRILNSKLDTISKATLISNFIGIDDEINHYYLRDIIDQG